MREKIKPTAKLKSIIKQCYPEYNGRKFYMDNKIPSKLDSYWDGGSRDYFCFYSLTTNEVRQVHSNHPFYESGRPSDVDIDTFPSDVIIVEMSIFCGKNVGITVYFKDISALPTPNVLSA